jgi:hypothetical protein
VRHALGGDAAGPWTTIQPAAAKQLSASAGYLIEVEGDMPVRGIGWGATACMGVVTLGITA